jgi:hypothetical protein
MEVADRMLINLPLFDCARLIRILNTRELLGTVVAWF